MDNQLVAWLQRGHQALLATFPPRTRKQFASLMLETGLWSPARLSLDSAIARVGDCLNPQNGGGQRFGIAELWLWMRESGNHALYDAMSDDLGYRTEPIPSEQRQQELLSRIDERLATVLSEISDLKALREQLTNRSPTSTTTAAPALSVVRFSRDHADDTTTEGF